jgi:hypothetical protein
MRVRKMRSQSEPNIGTAQSLTTIRNRQQSINLKSARRAWHVGKPRLARQSESAPRKTRKKIDLQSCTLEEVTRKAGDYLPSQIESILHNIVYAAIFSSNPNLTLSSAQEGTNESEETTQDPTLQETGSKTDS